MPNPPTSQMATGLLLFLLLTSALLLTSSGATTTKLSPSPPSPSPPPPHSRKAARSPPRSPPAPPPPAAPANCSDELVSFSKCLPYTSSSPNNTSNSPSRQCCNDVISAFTTGGAVCFCYLIQKPNLLGFPLNSTKVLSLTSLCPTRDHGTKTNFSLTSLCSGTRTLPPLKSITSPDHSSPRLSGPVNRPTPPAINFTQGSEESTADSDSPAPSYSDTSVPADSDTPTAPDGSHPEPRLAPRLPSWRPFSTSGTNSESAWLLALIMVVADVVVPTLT
nr:rho GTPase-activating protein gacJ-like [Coffea arabica]